MRHVNNLNGIQHLRGLVDRNIAIATTFKILFFSLFIALIISVSSFFFIQHHQSESIHNSIKQLAKTVETTASIATFTNDTELAKEVANGLMNNKVVSAVSIISDKKVLFVAGNHAKHSQHSQQNVYVEPLYSPFNHQEVIGSLDIHINQQQIVAESYQYAKFISLIMFGLIITISISLSLAINFNIIKPIQLIGETLHTMRNTELSIIETPAQHESDEIGRLVSDINALTQQQNALLLSEQSSRRRTQLIFEKNSNGLFIADYALNLSVWNNALEIILFQTHPLVMNENAQPNLVKTLHLYQANLESLLHQVIDNQSTQSIVLNLSDNEVMKWVEVTLQILDENTLQGIVTDISNHKKSEMLALAIAEQDTLTGLLNRRGLELKLLQKISTCQNDEGIAAMLIDLDGFKAVNDSAGHHAGDYVLEVIASRLKSTLRPQDVIARLGGDEFVVIVDELKNANDIEMVAKKIIQNISQPISFEGQSLSVGASIGISSTTQPYQDPSQLLKQADSAMYDAKHAGKRQFKVFGA